MKPIFYDDELHDGHVLFWVHGYQYSADIEVQRHTRERNVSFNGFNDEITRTTTRDNYFMPATFNRHMTRMAIRMVRIWRTKQKYLFNLN